LFTSILHLAPQVRHLRQAPSLNQKLLGPEFQQNMSISDFELQNDITH